MSRQIQVGRLAKLELQENRSSPYTLSLPTSIPKNNIILSEYTVISVNFLNKSSCERKWLNLLAVLGFLPKVGEIRDYSAEVVFVWFSKMAASKCTATNSKEWLLFVVAKLMAQKSFWVQG